MKKAQTIVLCGGLVNGIDLRVDNAVASVEIEGMHVSDRHRTLMRRCVRGEITYDQAVESIIRGTDL